MTSPHEAVKVLVVDDEVTVTDLLCEWLEAAGYIPVPAYDGQGGLQQFFRERPELAILDILMPEMGGLDLVRRIREVSDIPILMLSARGQEEDKVETLDLGADDHIVKPVGRRELLARVAAALRRANMKAPDGTDGTYNDSVITIDFRRHEVFVSGEPVHLTNLEYGLLTCLVRQAGQVLTYDQLLDQVWGPGYHSLNYITWHMGRLRRKLEQDPTDPECIVTVRGIGYRYERPAVPRPLRPGG